MAKGVPPKPQGESGSQDEQEDEGEEITADEIGAQLERVKWFLWHGNVYKALQVLGDLKRDLDILAERSAEALKLRKTLREFNGYIAANQSFIVNYGDRYRNGETISTAFVESTVNELVSKRFVKQQQMRWTKAGAHRLLQVRVQVLDDKLQRTFKRWYPGMRALDEQVPLAA